VELVFQKRLGLQVLGLGAPKLRLDSAQRSGAGEMPNLHFQNRKFLPEAWVYVSDDFFSELLVGFELGLFT
jgi:hypothetical protein